MAAQVESINFASGDTNDTSNVTSDGSNGEMTAAATIKEVGEIAGENVAEANKPGLLSRLFGMSTLSNIRTVKESLQQCRRDIQACTNRLSERQIGSGR